MHRESVDVDLKKPPELTKGLFNPFKCSNGNLLNDTAKLLLKALRDIESVFFQFKK